MTDRHAELSAALSRPGRFYCEPSTPGDGDTQVWTIRHRLGPPATEDISALPNAVRAMLATFDGALLFWGRSKHNDARPRNSFALRVLSQSASARHTAEFREMYGPDDEWFTRLSIVALVGNGDLYATCDDDEIGVDGAGRPVYFLDHEGLYGDYQADLGDVFATDLFTLVIETLNDPKPMLDYWRYLDDRGQQYYVARIEFDQP